MPCRAPATSICCPGWGRIQCVEAPLDKIRPPVYVRALESEPRWAWGKRYGLVYLAVLEQDEECVRVIAMECSIMIMYQ
jgi:hypothetical protein